MIRSIALAVVLVMLVTSTALAAPAPDNYCTTVNVEAETSGYTVTATGAGRYARVRDLTAGQTVVATDFGSGATVYVWTGLALDTEHQYQVQVSHTSLMTGYSTTGCVFTPPVPQAVVIDRFEIVNGAFEWDATEDGLGYWVEYLGKPVTAWTPAQAPGMWGWFSYHVAPLPTMARSLPYGTYYLWSQDMTATGIVAIYQHGGEPGND